MLSGRSEVIAIVTAVFLGISLVTVVLRCFVRLRVVRAFGWDDGLMLIAMMLNVAFAICGIMGAHYGMGRKLEYFATQPDRFRSALLCWWLGQNFYVITCVMAKISIILTLLRITVHKVHVIILHAVTALTVVIGLLFFFFTIFQCTPVDFFWNRLSGDGKCVDSDILIAIAYLYSAGAAITDFTIGLLPAFMIWNLRMTQRDKVAVAGILGLGCVASAAVIVRIPYIQNYKDVEFLYNTTSISIWSNIEAGLGITAGSLTTLRPLTRFFREVSYGSRTHTRNPGSFPLSSTIVGGHNTPNIQSKMDTDDAQQLWTGPVETDRFHGVRTVVLGSGRVAAAPVSSSEEELTHPHTVMGSRGLGGRMGKG